MDTLVFDFHRFSIDDRMQLVEDIWESILEEELERAHTRALSPARAAELPRGVVDADARPDDEIS